MSRTPDPRNDDVAARRQRARRTALWMAGIAVAVYVAFLLSGILGR